MPADAAKPVFRVGVIRFAAMHDPVQKTAVGAGDVLRDRVRLIQMIVPEQRSGTHGRLKRSVELRFREEANRFSDSIQARASDWRAEMSRAPAIPIWR